MQLFLVLSSFELKIDIITAIPMLVYCCARKIIYLIVGEHDWRAGDNGSMWFWDYKSGHNFQQAQTIVQPGILFTHLHVLCVLSSRTS